MSNSSNSACRYCGSTRMPMHNNILRADGVTIPCLASEIPFYRNALAEMTEKHDNLRGLCAEAAAQLRHADAENPNNGWCGCATFGYRHSPDCRVTVLLDQIDGVIAEVLLSQYNGTTAECPKCPEARNQGRRCECGQPIASDWQSRKP